MRDAFDLTHGDVRQRRLLHLLALVAATRGGTLAQAARELGITRPAAAKSLARHGLSWSALNEAVRSCTTWVAALEAAGLAPPGATRPSAPSE